VGLGPEAVPEIAPADVEGTQRRNRGRAVLYPAHARSLQTFADDFAACLCGTAADVPALLPVGRIIGAMAIVLEVADELAQLLPNLCRRAGRQRDRAQVSEQGFTPLLIENALGLLLPLPTGLVVVSVPHLRKSAKVFGGMIP